MNQQIIDKIHHYVSEKLAHDHSGHDLAHVCRVVKLAQRIQKTEPDADLFIVTASAYFHDVIDVKVVDDVATATLELCQFMQSIGISQVQQDAILSIIANLSFRKNLTQKQSLSLEGKIVQDADRLDAIGAIGIGRTFYYGGNKGHIMHDPNLAPRINMTEQEYNQPNTVINHFYEKLLLLKETLNTLEAKKIATKRHQFLLDFVKQFEDEWLSKNL
ncbi:HD domain-containing protein [Orbaceae bacterium ac157xtp]